MGLLPNPCMMRLEVLRTGIRWNFVLRFNLWLPAWVFDAHRFREHHEQRPGPRSLTRTVLCSCTRSGGQPGIEMGSTN